VSPIVSRTCEQQRPPPATRPGEAGPVARREGRAREHGDRCIPSSRRELEPSGDSLDQGGGLPFSLGTPQRNRNELGETTVNKMRQEHLSQREKSIT
jgi:hypothetical protein